LLDWFSHSSSTEYLRTRWSYNVLQKQLLCSARTGFSHVLRRMVFCVKQVLGLELLYMCVWYTNYFSAFIASRVKVSLTEEPGEIDWCNRAFGLPSTKAEVLCGTPFGVHFVPGVASGVKRSEHEANS